MPIQVFELLGSRLGSDGPNATSVWKYMVKGSDDDSAIKLAVRAAAPTGFIVPGTPLNQVFSLDNVSLDEQHTDGLWTCSANYKLIDQKEPETGDNVYAFDTTGGIQHITQSIKTKGRFPSTAPDLGGAIGVTGDSVDGVDITVPTFAFSETHYIDAALVNDAYKGVLFKLTGTVCDAPFKGGQKGEILFLGATGQKRGKGDYEINFKFGGSPNVTGLSVGSITGIIKGGWDYLWVRYVTKEVGSGADKMLTQSPKAVYVEQVYPDGTLTLLGIGS